MSEVVSMSFKIIEPMMFRGPGEFDPFVRGTYSRATTLMMPSPSTVTGTLATYCISELGKAVPSSDDWLNRYVSVLGNDARVKGPLIKLDQGLMVEDRLSEGFLTMEEVRRKCDEVWKKLIREPSSLELLDEYLEEKKFESSIKIEKSVRVGIMLQTRESWVAISMKNTKEGFLYSVEYLDYMKAKGRETRKMEDIKKIPVEIIVEIRGELVKSLPSVKELAVRFGGEGRIASLSIQRGEKILNEIKKCWNGKVEHDGFLALYTATPTLFKGGKRVEEYVRQWADKINCKFLGISGESTVLGAGFMIGKKKRKPIYTSLNPGSIIFLEGKFDLSRVYQDCSLGEAGMLGYGTLIPIPISSNI